jgi:hypothetical protein
MLDSGPDAEKLRAQRAQHQAAYERKNRRRWGARANAICKDLDRQSSALIERYDLRAPQEIVQFLETSLRQHSRAIGRIERLGPARNRRLHGRLMHQLQVFLVASRRDLASLRARWSPTAYERFGQSLERRSRVINRLFRRLGSATCAEI